MVKTINVTEEQIKELGNAIAAYGDILWNIYLGLSVPHKYESLTNMSKGDLMVRMDALKTLHADLSE